MAAWHSTMKILFVLAIYLFVYLEYTGTASTSGPYRTIIEDVLVCKKPSHPYMKNPPIIFVSRIYNISNRNLLSGNITVKMDIKNVENRIKSFVWDGHAWKVNYLMSSISCRSKLLKLLLRAANTKYDSEHCVVLKGQYSFKNLNFNSLLHLWTSKMEYGKIMWRSEAFNRKLGTFSCIEIYSVTVPA